MNEEATEQGEERRRSGKGTVWLSPEQKKMAELARSRARFFGYGEVAEVADGEELVGGESVEEVRNGGGCGKRKEGGEFRCARCLGRGYLSCMACSD